MAETVDYRIGRITDLRLPEGANFAAEFTFSGLSLTGYEATLTARRGDRGGRVPFTWSKSGISLTSTTVSFDIGPATTDDAGKAFSTVTAHGSTDYALTIRQSGGGAIVMRLQGEVAWVDDVGDYDPGTSGSNQIAVTVGSGTAVTVSLTNNGHSPLSLDATTADVLTVNNQVLSADDAGSDKLLFWDESEGKLSHAAIGSGLTMTGTTLSASGGAGVTVSDTSSIDLTLTGQQISAAAIFGTTSGTVCQGNDARLSDARTPTTHAHAMSDVTNLQTTLDSKVSSIGASAADVLSVATGAITADDPGADRLIFWDESENKLTHLTAGSGLTISGTTITATGSGDVTGPASSVDNRIPIFVGTGGKTIEDSGVVLTPASAAVSEVFTATFAAADPADYTGANGYMVIYSTTETVGVWFYNAAAFNFQPSASVDRWIQAEIVGTANDVGASYAAEAAINADADFNATVNNNVLTVTVATPGVPFTSPPNSPIGISFSVTTPGAAATLATFGQSDGSLIENIDASHIVAIGQTPSSSTFLSGTDGWQYPVPSGSRGDIDITFNGTTYTISSNAVTTAKINNDAVTYAKMQNISATSRVIGRKSSGSGDAEECTLSEILDFVGSAAQGDILYRGASGWTRLAAGTSGNYLKTLGSGANPEWAAVPTNGQLGIVIDGSGSVITTGVKGYLRVPYNCTINSVEIVANASGSIVVDIWKDTYANFPPLVADAITGSAKPTLSSAQKSQSSTLTGWTTSLSAGDYLAFNVDSVTTVSRVTLTLIVTRTT